MSSYFITGKLGNGKTLISISRAKFYLNEGRKVATNVDIFLDKMFHSRADTNNLIRIPDKPDFFDFEAIGRGNESRDESKNGLLILDECGTWFNSRGWQEKGRAEINDWFLHSRKLGWDLLFIVQDIDLIDAQARKSLSEHTVFCRRMDNYKIPVFSTFFSMFGIKLKFPKFHVGRVVVGTSFSDPLSDRWVYKGVDLYSAYDTYQKFTSSYSHGVHSVLSPHQLNKHKYAKRDLNFYMRITKIYFKKFKAPIVLSFGVFMGLFFSAVFTSFMYSKFLSDYEALSKAIIEAEQNGIIRSDESVVLVDDSDSLSLEVFEGYRISGYTNISGSITYDLVDVDKLSSDSDTDLASTISTSMLTDFDIDPRGPCHARIGRGGRYSDIYCI